MPIPQQLTGQKYASLTTYKKDGTPVRTPIWFAELDGKLYVQTRNDSWKYKRLRRNPEVKVAPCTMRGKVTGPDFAAHARILPPQSWEPPRRALRQKYWLARLPFWSKHNEVIEIEILS